MARPFMFRDPVTAKAEPPKLDIWLEFGERCVLLRARHEGDSAEQNLAAIRFDEKDFKLYLESLPLAPKRPGRSDVVPNLRILLGGPLIALQPGVIESGTVAAASDVPSVERAGE